MDITSLHELFERLNRREQLPAFAIGMLVGLVLFILILRLLRVRLVGISARNPEVARLWKQMEDLRVEGRESENQHEAVRRERDALHARCNELAGFREAQVRTIDQMTEDCERWKDDAVTTGQKLQRLTERYRKQKRRILQIEGRLEKFVKSDGRLWEVPPVQPPPFQRLSMRRMPILSLVNLKGGVGKTTLTANLAAAMAELGQRVLVVDLDYQGSLSHLCLESHVMDELAGSRRLVHQSLENPDQGLSLFQAAIQCMSLVPNEKAYIVAAGEELADVEHGLAERWRVGATDDDIRYRLRSILHSDEIASRFDIVLLDCPPRLTTACMNALCASDFVLIPVLPHEVSSLAVPRLLRWIKKLRPIAFPDLDVLGMIGNKTKYHLDAPIRRHETELASLAVHCLDVWGTALKFFDPMKVHDSVDGRFAALDSKFAPPYLDLAENILKELPSHARRRVASVSPLLDRASGSRRS